ncbi:MAG: RagB/SusD family nutrient uptake outer membrane protein [Candidatus Marinimicrobia bacterium]|nr:RagB/SusD family nutrient uptake outer membrane protein [Candidatus Neomarinimicrobiota bacterium]
MKLKKILMFLISLYVLTFFACEEQILYTQPESTFSEKDVWSDIKLARKFAFDQYNALNSFSLSRVNWGGGIMMMSSICDESYNKWSIVETINQGTISPSQKEWIFNNTWRYRYKFIRNINMFLENIDEVDNASQEEIERLKGEMKYIRARLYFKLINFNGGVPIITKVFGLDEEFEEERDSYEDCVNFIVEELDEAADMLDLQAPQWGRITKGACLAMKSRVLLYAAGKLHDPGTSRLASGPLFDYDVSNKWQEAADAAEAVIIDLNQYSLVQTENWKDYQNMFISNNSEVILARPFHSEFGTSEYRPDLMNSPNGYGGWACNTPTQNIVDDYEMDNGKMINEAGSGYSVDSMYQDRDPRFYANILYNGSMFRGREVEGFIPGGKDSKDGPGGWNFSRTGYWMRKFMDESIDFTTTMGNQPWILIRLAEIYLNYAEAQYHLGNEGTAREYVNKVRRRVGMPEISTSGQELLEDIKHEREIELMFEGHRFFDLRRWMDGEELNEACRGIEWKKLDEESELASDGELTPNFIDVAERNFTDKLYYFPLDYSEISKTGMQQNPGY